MVLLDYSQMCFMSRRIFQQWTDLHTPQNPTPEAVILFDEQRTANRYYSDFFSIRGSTQNHDFVVRANSEQANRPIASLPATTKTDVIMDIE